VIHLVLVTLPLGDFDYCVELHVCPLLAPRRPAWRCLADVYPLVLG
jgi:hypothetical protein